VFDHDVFLVFSVLSRSPRDHPADFFCSFLPMEKLVDLQASAIHVSKIRIEFMICCLQKAGRSWVPEKREEV
jgi:hypothetical protein